MTELTITEGRTDYTKEFIENMKNIDVEVVQFYKITEEMLRRFFNKNKDKVEEMLIIMKKGEKSK